MNTDSKTEIREYLLGRVTDDAKLEGIEERMFADNDFCAEVEVVEEELVHNYVFGKLSREDRKAFDEKIAGNSELKFKAEMADALREKARQETAAETKPGFLASIKAFLQTPAYVGAFAVLLIATLAVSWFIFNRAGGGDQLAELKNVYQKERAVESRISGFEYAPAGAATRGADTADDAVKNRLRLIETKLLEAVVNSPSAENHHALGVFYLTQKDFPKAIKELAKAVELADKNARFHNDLGSAYFESALNGGAKKNTGDLARANDEFTKALELDPQFLEALFNKSLALQKLNLTGQAKESWNLYLQKDASSKWADEARKYLAELEGQQSSIKKKKDILPEFLDAFRRKDEQTLWKIHTETKAIFSGVSPPEQLTAVYLKARREHDEVQAKEALEALNYIGEKEKNADFFFAELAAFYSALDDTQIDTLLKAKELWAEGYMLVHQAQGKQAIQQFEESKKLYLQARDPAEANIAELWIAQVLPDIDKIAESRTRLNALIASTEQQNFKVFLPTAYYWLNICAGRQQQLSDAIRSGQRAIQIAEEITAVNELQHAVELVASNYSDLGEPERALTYLDKVVDRKEPYYVDKNQTCRNFLAFSQLLLQLGLNSSAADFARESLTLSKEILGNTDMVNGSYRDLTKALSAKNQLDDALRFAGESNQLALDRQPTAENDKTIASTYLLLADLKRRMENCGEALTDYEKALESYAKLPETTSYLYSVHKGKLLCLQTLGRQSEFESELQRVLQLSEEYRQNIREDNSRQGFFDNEQIVFDAAIANSLQQNDPQKAFQLVETSKARSLLDFVRSDKSIAEVEKEFVAVAKPITLEEIRSRMPENVQVVQYAVLPEKLAIWTVTKTGFEYSEKQIDAAELEKKIVAYQKAVRGNTDAASLRAAARELYDLLLPANLDSTKMICLIPDKSLYRMPFASLVSAQNKFLIEGSAVFYSPSASIMVLAGENAGRKEKVIAEHLLGIGNPSFDREESPKLADLPEAEMEVRSIAGNYPGALQFTGDSATKESFLSNIQNAEVIHFAGHFVANEQIPGYSKLLLAGSDLRSFELAGQRLSKAKLVVLSACETGFEGYNRSEGAIGIARTFLATGSPLVLASAWKVDSKAARDLMIAFHHNRKVKGMNSAESLRQAQLELLKNDATATPYYWSAFNLVGGFANY